MDFTSARIAFVLVGVCACTPGHRKVGTIVVSRAQPSAENASDLPDFETIRRLPRDALTKFAHDPRSPVRRLVAHELSANPSAEWLDAVVSLARDDEPDVASAAAVGLVRMRSERASAELVGVLRDADAQRLEVLLHAVEDVVGAEGLVLALQVVKDPPKRAELFKRIRALADPRAADELTRFAAREPGLHFRTLAAFAMAETADLRSVPLLADRLGQDEQKVYGETTEYEKMVKRYNSERTVAARLLADLLAVYPNEVDSIRAQTEEAVLKWATETHTPPPNAIRALARMKSERARALIRRWADPTVPLPKPRTQPPVPDEWLAVMPALRYAGAMKDGPSWVVLERALHLRKDPLDLTMDAMMRGGPVILGMTVRAVGMGAAQGFAEWGDHRAFAPLLTYIQNPRENEQSRSEACMALAWLTNPQDVDRIVALIEKYGASDPKDRFRRQCLLEMLPRHPSSLAAPAILRLLEPSAPPEVLHGAARAIGRAGLDEATAARLFELMKLPALKDDAALALLLGGTRGTAARVATQLGAQQESLENLHDLWFRSFDYWSREDLGEGHIFRWVNNADAVSEVESGDQVQVWTRQTLEKQFEHLDFDNGPHSITRVVLRYELRRIAEHENGPNRDNAVRVLQFMKERGTLLALHDLARERAAGVTPEVH